MRQFEVPNQVANEANLWHKQACRGNRRPHKRIARTLTSLANIRFRCRSVLCMNLIPRNTVIPSRGFGAKGSAFPPPDQKADPQAAPVFPIPEQPAGGLGMTVFKDSARRRHFANSGDRASLHKLIGQAWGMPVCCKGAKALVEVTARTC